MLVEIVKHHERGKTIQLCLKIPLHVRFIDTFWDNEESTRKEVEVKKVTCGNHVVNSISISRLIIWSGNEVFSCDIPLVVVFQLFKIKWGSSGYFITAVFESENSDRIFDLNSWIIQDSFTINFPKFCSLNSLNSHIKKLTFAKKGKESKNCGMTLHDNTTTKRSEMRVTQFPCTKHSSDNNNGSRNLFSWPYATFINISLLWFDFLIPLSLCVVL